MGKLTLTAFTTLDGVTQAPGGPNEDTDGGFTHGGWLVPFADQKMGEFMTEVFERAEAFLLGRRTYEILADHWPKVSDPTDVIAARLNGLPKYVASRTKRELGWDGSTLVSDVAATVTRLKRLYSGEIQVHGSGNLARALLQADLVDEINLLTFPVTLGAGKRMFDPGLPPLSLELKRFEVSTKGAVFAVYTCSGAVATGDTTRLTTRELFESVIRG